MGDERPRRRMLLLLVLAWALLPTVTFPAPVDPVSQFIAAADSAAADDVGALVAVKGALVGAAVARLLAEAIEAGDAGDTAAETRLVALAERIAQKHLAASEVPLQLIETYRSWGEPERAKRREANALRQKADDARAAGNLLFAAGFLEQARTLYEAIDDRHSAAVVWGSLGVVHWHAGDLTAVRRDYEHALAARRAVDDHILTARTLNGLGSVSYRSGLLNDAESFYKQAIELRGRTGDIVGLATSHTYLANVYVDMRRLDEARDQFETALPLVESSGSARQQLELLDGYAKLDFETGRVNRAAQTYAEALEIAVEQAYVAEEISIRNNLATVFDRQDRYHEALEELSTVESLLADHPNPQQSLFHLSNRGMVYMNAGEWDKARADLLAFLAGAEERGESDHQRQALINLGYLLKQMGAYERAIEYTNRARAIAALSNDSRAQREGAILMADIALSQGRGEVTQEMCELARELDERDGATSLVVHDDIGIASALARQGRMQEARSKFYDAIPRAAETGQGFLATAALFGIAHTWESENVDSAAHYYERSLARLEKRRAAIGGAGMRTGFLSGDRRFYYEEVARFYGHCDPHGDGAWSARAFTTIERAKARGLLDLVDNALRRAPSPEEEKLLDELYGLNSTPATDAEQSRRREQLEAKYIRARESRAGSAYEHALDSDRIATIAEVQARLADDGAMVAYALGDTASLVWAITPSRHTLGEIAGRRALAEQVDRLRDAIGRPGAGDAALRAAANDLYNELLAPVAELLADVTSLVLVPDGKLFELPFEALLAEPAAEDAGWGDLAFVARRFDATLVAPSASVWLELSGRTPIAYEHELVAFGDPDYTRLEPKPGRSATLAPLPFTREEVLAVSAGVSDERKAVYLGASANEATLKREMARGARILHLATHGLVDPVEPASSSVALCPDDESGDDGYLHTLEILSSRIDAGLVVLSACESARGRIGRGEGVVGLGRAFIASGARGIVASLWPVSDKSTAALMSNFYEEMLDDKKPAARAMNHARRALLDSEGFSHPFHWAPFVVVGTSTAPW